MGEVLGDGTEGNVFIQLFGDKGMTEQIQLRQAGNSKIRFEKGRTYKFTVETIDIGKVRFAWNVFSEISARHSSVRCVQCSEEQHVSDSSLYVCVSPCIEHVSATVCDSQTGAERDNGYIIFQW